jgi:hypothetical protein
MMPAPTMPLSAPVARPTPLGTLQRIRVLTRAADRALKTRLGAQLAKLSAWIIALGYAITMLLLARGTRGALLEVLLADALGWLSWLTAGLAALSAAGAAKEPAEERALISLVEQRGFVRARLADARGLAVMRRILRLTLIPALALSLLALALSGSLGMAGWRLLLCLAAAGYVVVLAVLVGGLAHIAGVLAPHQARTLLLIFLFAPHMARVVWRELPSVPWALGFLLERIERMGGMAG